MRNQLETFKSLFEQVRNLGIVMELPNNEHTKLSRNINVYFAENCNVTSVTFGDHYEQQVDIMKYSVRDENYKVSFPIDIADVQLDFLIAVVNSEFKRLKLEHLRNEIARLENEDDIVELEREEVAI